MPPCKYGAATQDPLPEDTLDKINETRVKIIQQVIGGVLYYAQAVDLTSIASEKANATEDTEQRVSQLLDYLATHPDAKVRYHASNMVLNIHSDASYLSGIGAKSRMADQYFLGSVPRKDRPIALNGAIFVFCGILKIVVASAAEAELGVLFLNCKE